MNYDALKAWIDLAQFVWIIGATIWAFWGSKDKAIRAKLGKHAESIGEIDVRITRIEESSKHVPTHEDLSVMHEKMNELSQMVERIGGDVRATKAEVAGVRGLIVPMQRTIELVNEHLLNQSKP